MGFKKWGCVQDICKECVRTVGGQATHMSVVATCGPSELAVQCWFSNLPIRIFSPRFFGGRKWI